MTHTNSKDGIHQLSRFRRASPVVLLFFLAPVIGEYLLGNLTVSEWYYLPFLSVLYGAGAIVIREVSRRAGRGYGTMLGLGAAYAIFEEGIVDQMLFNFHYFAGQAENAQTIVPGIHVDAWLTLIAVALHTLWSTFIPILIVEGLHAERRSHPWLSARGLAGVVSVFILGSAWICYQTYTENSFWASPLQLATASVLIVAIIAATFLHKTKPARRITRRVPAAGIVALAAFAFTSIFMLTEQLPGWLRVAGCLAVALAAGCAIYFWRRSKDWSVRHAYAACGGALATYAWIGMFMVPESGPKLLRDHIGFVCIALAVLWLFSASYRKISSLPPSKG